MTPDPQAFNAQLAAVEAAMNEPITPELANAYRRLGKAREMAELYFEPWGAAKGARWEALTGDKPFHAETALVYIRVALNDEAI